MMSNVILQVLLILAYLAIGLVAITFPIYAICVAFLPQEKWESEKEREKRIEKLRGKISELTAELKGEQHDRGRVTQLKEQLGRYESELKGTEMKDYYLTARGAVGQPVIYLALALLSVGLGIFSFELEVLEGVITFGFFSVLGSAMAILRLYKTISAVEYAALRPARTVSFNIEFREGTTRKELKRGKNGEFNLRAWTDEQDVENFSLWAQFPPELEIPVKSGPNFDIIKYPEHTQVVIEQAFLPRTAMIGFRLTPAPKKTGKYSIPVKVHGKGIYEVQKELTIEVVK